MRPYRLDDIAGGHRHWGARTHVPVIVVLPYSSYAYKDAFLEIKQDAWITSHVNMYCCILTPDNLKTDVVKNSRTEAVFNNSHQ